MDKEDDDHTSSTEELFIGATDNIGLSPREQMNFKLDTRYKLECCHKALLVLKEKPHVVEGKWVKLKAYSGKLSPLRADGN